MLATKCGKKLETVALKYLEKQGLALIVRNFTVPYGELDLVMLERKTLVFVEVRYRRTTNYGSGAASITHSKQLRLQKAAVSFLVRHLEFRTSPCRFDVVSISGDPPYQINWISDAFWLDWH